MRVAALVRELAPGASTAEARVVARTAVHLVSGLLLVAMSSSPSVSRTLIAETKIALRAYLVARLGFASG
jgi:hypothetical protein